MTTSSMSSSGLRVEDPSGKVACANYVPSLGCIDVAIATATTSFVVTVWAISMRSTPSTLSKSVFFNAAWITMQIANEWSIEMGRAPFQEVIHS